ncbi:TIGR01457 family HAD-type hydrolase [Halobacillus salinarum]|uniref:TIGR01457 family HAD-type hydrolase n=1 Tax=Halobacillus salinarum TaxID=2932257 RepID=A0ABY4ENK5_9BACI|nr:TIGR01457 family HAD-type hydrolase [Halobacillus salinarum]UOQ46045.1 TIGR01457 family HAD-type hydrolase [Halobacillus salinarum]
MKNYQAYFIDLDGTMYRGTERVEGAAEFVQYLRKHQLPLLFLTNNSSRKQEQVAAKLMDMGIEAYPEDVFTTSMATASYIARHHANAKVFAVGEEGLVQALQDQGLELVDAGADYVVIGIDREISYEKLSKACLNVREGAALLSTNGDVAIPTERGMLPGNGAFTSVVSVSTGVEAVFIGKPHAEIMEQALAKMNLSKDEVLMIGDNYDTDILAGINAEMDTLMVETGVHRFEEISAYPKQPTYKVKTLQEWLS